MKRLLPALFLLFLTVIELDAQSLTRMQGWGLDLQSVHWISNQQGVGVGEKLIIRTTDGGTTWEEVLQEFDLRFHDVVFLDENRGVAVGEKGAIFTTNDAGTSWQEKNSGSSNDLLSIAKTSANGLIATGSNGEILQSNDGAITWKKINSGSTQNLNDVHFRSESFGAIAAGMGKILQSTDGGATWTESSLGQNEDLYGIAFSSELIGYVVGANGLFAKTIDGGSSWITLNSGTTNSLRKVAVSPADLRIVVALGDLGTVIRSANSGTSFTKPSLGATFTRNLSGIAFKPASNQASALGQDGYLANSTNGGANWSQKFAGIRNHFTTADFKAINSGFVAGENGSLYVTGNGAASLTHRPLPEQIRIESLDFWNTSFGYTGSADGKIYRTSNAGSAWVPTFNTSGRTITGFYLFAPSVVYLTGSKGYISRSTDSGVTWDQAVKSNTTENLRDLMFFDYGYGFAIGENGQISWSFGGTNWETIPKVTSENLNALAKIDTTRAVVVGDGGIILKTQDKARTWKKIESGTTKNLLSIDFFGEFYGFISGEDGLALLTSDAGETWIPLPTGTIRDLNAVSAGTNQKAYFAGEDGTILSFACVPPTGSLGEIVGGSQSCLSTTTYSIVASPQPGSNIIWRVDGGQILSGQGTPEIEVEWTSVGRNAVLVGRSNFCGTGETSALEVNVIDLPSAASSVSGEGGVCQGIPYTYALPHLEGVSYTWAVSSGQINSGQGTNQVEVTWAQTGSQQISVIQENSCGKAATIQRTITVHTAPAEPSTISGEALTSPGEAIYEIEALAGLNYRWTITESAGRIVSGQGSGEITVLWESEGDFEVYVEAQNECGYSPKRSLPVNVNVITALEPKEEPQLKIYPNPSPGWVSISSARLDIWTELAVLNALGQEVMRRPIGLGETEIHLSALPRGLLFVRLESQSGVVTRKLQVR